MSRIKKKTEFVPLKDMSKYMDMIDELCMVQEGLSNTEMNFLDKLLDWVGCFTVPMAEWLEKIWNRRFQ